MENERVIAFKNAIKILPSRLQTEILKLSTNLIEQIEEIRLRIEQPLSISIAGKEIGLPMQPVNSEELNDTLNRATRFSIHSFSDNLQYGFITTENGHRLGICGTIVVKDDKMHSVRNVSSINLRIACDVIGISKDLMPDIQQGNAVKNTLIISPPALGKTTLLRDIIRNLSNNFIRVAVADSRFEISGNNNGIHQFDLGITTDVMCGGSKLESCMALIKTMSPMVLVLDEITSKDDTKALIEACYCGVSVIATAHANGIKDLQRRGIYKQLMDFGIFEDIITIDMQNGKRIYKHQNIV